MKHSIKREQSHARMSFAEYENQRSLAEGESNVRATLKHMKLSFNLILILAFWLVATQTATAQEAAVYDLVAIGTLNTTTGEMTFDSEAWYTLDGVRLSGKPSTKGIYINNDKKVVIK